MPGINRNGVMVLPDRRDDDGHFQRIAGSQSELTAVNYWA